MDGSEIAPRQVDGRGSGTWRGGGLRAHACVCVWAGMYLFAFERYSVQEWRETNCRAREYLEARIWGHLSEAGKWSLPVSLWSVPSGGQF